MATANVKLTLFQGTPETDEGGTTRDVIRVKVLPETYGGADATNVRLSTTSAGDSFFTKYQFQLVKTSDEDDFLSDLVLNVDSLLPNDNTGFFVNLPLVQGTIENGVVSLEDNTTYKVICTATKRTGGTQTGTAELTVTAQPKQRDNVNQGTLALGNFSTSDDTLNFSLTNTKIVSQAPGTVNGVEGLTYNANQALIDEIILTVYEVDSNGAKQNEATHTYSIDMSSKEDGTSKNVHFATQNGGNANDANGTLRAKGLTATHTSTSVAGKLATSADVTNDIAAGDFMADSSGATVTTDVETYSFSFNEETQQILKKGTSDQYFDFDNNTYVFVKLTVVSGSFSTVFESTVGTTVELTGSSPLISYPAGSPAPIFITNIPNDCRLEVVQKTQKNGKNKLECKFIEPNPIAGANLTNLKLQLRVKMSDTASDRVSRTVEFDAAALAARRKTVTAIDTVIYTFTIATTDNLSEATPVVGGETNSTNIKAPNTGDIILIGAGTTVDGNTTYSQFLVAGKQVFFAWEPSNNSGPNTSQNNIGTNQGQRLRELTYVEGRRGDTVQTITETTIDPTDADINGIQVVARGLSQQGNISDASARNLIVLINELADPTAARPQDGVDGGSAIEKISEASFLEFATVDAEGDGNCEFTVSFNDSAATRSVLDANDAFTPLRRLRQKVDIKSIRVDIVVEDIGNGNEAYAKTGDPGTLLTDNLTYYSNTFTIAELTTIENGRSSEFGGTGATTNNPNYLTSKIMTTETNAHVQFLSLTGATDISGGTISLAGYVDSDNGDSSTVTIAANSANALRDAIQSFNKVDAGAAVTIRAHVIKIPGDANNLGGVTTDEYEILLTLDADVTNNVLTYTQLASNALLSYTKAGITTDATAETYTKYKFDLRNPTAANAGNEGNIFGFHAFPGTNKFRDIAVHQLTPLNRLYWRMTHSMFDESLLIPDTSQPAFKLGSGNNVTVQFWVENEFGIVNTSSFETKSYYKGIGTVALPNLIPAESIVTVNEQALADRTANQIKFTIKDDQPRLTTSDSTLINMEKLEVVVKVTRGTAATTYTMVFEEDAASTDTVKLVDTRNATDGGAALFTVSQPGADNKTTFNFTLKNGVAVPGTSSADFSLQPNDIFEIVSTKMENAYGVGVTTDKTSYVLEGGAVTKGFTLGTTTNRFYSLRAEGVSALTTGFKNNAAFDKTLIKADLLETIVDGVVTKDQNIVLRIANHSTVGANNNYSELITANGAQETITIAIYRADGTNLLASGAKTIATRAAFNTTIDGNTSSALAATGGSGPGDVLSFAVSDTELGEFQAQASPVVKAIVTLTTNHLNGNAPTDTYTYTFSNKLQVTRPTITSISIPTSSVGTRELLTNPSSADITATVTLDVVSGGAVKATHGTPTKLVNKLMVVANNKPALNTSKYQNPGGTNFTAAIAAAKAAAADPGHLHGVPASTFSGTRQIADINTTLTWTGESISNAIPVTFSIPSELFGCEFFVESHLEYEVSGGLASDLTGRRTRTLINGDAKYNLTTSANTEYLEQFTTATGNTGRIGANAATLTSLLTAQSNLAMLVAPMELLPRQSGYAESSSAPNMPEFGVKGNGEVGVNFRSNGHVPSDGLAITLLNGNETMSFKNDLVHNDKIEYNTAMRAGLCEHVAIRTTDEFKLTLNGRSVNVTAGTTTYEQLIALETAALANGRRTNDISTNEEIVILESGATLDGGNITDITKSVNTPADRTSIAAKVAAGNVVAVGDIIVYMFANEVSISTTDGGNNPAGALLYNAIADQFGTNPVQDAPLIRTEGIIDKTVSAALSADGALYLAATTPKHQASGNAVSIADVDNVTRFGVDGAVTIADVSLTTGDLVASGNLTLATPNS